MWQEEGGGSTEPTHVFSTRCTVARCVSLRCCSRVARVLYPGRTCRKESPRNCRVSCTCRNVSSRQKSERERATFINGTSHEVYLAGISCAVRENSSSLRTSERERVARTLGCPSFRGGVLGGHSGRRCRAATSGRRGRRVLLGSPPVALRSFFDVDYPRGRERRRRGLPEGPRKVARGRSVRSFARSLARIFEFLGERTPHDAIARTRRVTSPSPCRDACRGVLNVKDTGDGESSARRDSRGEGVGRALSNCSREELLPVKLGDVVHCRRRIRA